MGYGAEGVASGRYRGEAHRGEGPGVDRAIRRAESGDRTSDCERERLADAGGTRLALGYRRIRVTAQLVETKHPSVGGTI